MNHHPCGDRVGKLVSLYDCLHKFVANYECKYVFTRHGMREMVILSSYRERPAALSVTPKTVVIDHVAAAPKQIWYFPGGFQKEGYVYGIHCNNNTRRKYERPAGNPRNVHRLDTTSTGYATEKNRGEERHGKENERR